MSERPTGSTTEDRVAVYAMLGVVCMGVIGLMFLAFAAWMDWQ